LLASARRAKRSPLRRLGGTPDTRRRVRCRGSLTRGLFLALLATGPLFAQQAVRKASPARWDGSFGTPGPAGPALSFALFDDGTGEQLYVAGNFDSVGNRTTLDLARWNGLKWESVPVPSDTNTAFDGASALCVFDDGAGPRLFVGGHYTNGPDTIGLLAWDGTSWEEFTIVTVVQTGGVRSLFTDGSSLYAGGRFDSIDGVSVRNIACYDATGWQAMGSTIPGPASVGTIATSDAQGSPRLYVGTSPTAANDPTLYWWDGASWISVPGFRSQVSALLDYDGPSGSELLVSVFQQPLLSLTGAGSATFAPGAPTAVLAMVSREENGFPVLYAGGDFATAGGKEVGGITRWNGSSWQALGPAPAGVQGPDPYIEDLVFADLGAGEQLFVCGNFGSAGGQAAANAAAWSPGSWQALGPRSEGVGYASFSSFFTYGIEFAVFDDGGGPKLYIAGQLTAGSLRVQSLARWEDDRWAPVPGNPFSPSDAITTMHVWDDGTGPALYIGGSFLVLGSRSIVRWDGETWSGLGSGVFGLVDSIESFDDGSGSQLWVAGSFGQAGGIVARNLARWNGALWSAAGDPDDRVNALEAWNDGGGRKLYASGFFTEVGGVPVSNIASWDGSTWDDLDGGLVGPTVSGGLRAVDLPGLGGRQLLVFGNVLQAGGASVTGGLARWTGTAWGTDLGFPADWTSGVACWNDGTGTKLYAGGQVPGVAGSRHQLWALDGAGWRVLGGFQTLPLWLFAYESGPLGPSLWCAGSDLFFGERASFGVARLHRPGLALEFTAPVAAPSSLGAPVELLGGFDPERGEAILRVGGRPASAGAILLGTELAQGAPGAVPSLAVSGIVSMRLVELGPSGELELSLRLPNEPRSTKLYAQAVLFAGPQEPTLSSVLGIEVSPQEE
jgi:hypothetical protein